jgi:hypothetical protein
MCDGEMIMKYKLIMVWKEANCGLFEIIIPVSTWEGSERAQNTSIKIYGNSAMLSTNYLIHFYLFPYLKFIKAQR